MHSDILARVQASRALFEPRSIDGMAALYFARRFEDLPHVREYACGVARVGLRAAAEVYRAARVAGDLRGQGERFRAALEGSEVGGPAFPLLQLPIISMRIKRRAICLAVFLGSELHYTQVHVLPSGSRAAQTSSSGFVRWCLAHFPNGVLALEAGVDGEFTRSRELFEAVLVVAREGGAPVWEVPTSEMFGLFAEPPMRTRAKFRDAVAALCPPPPHDSGHRALLDAIGLGLVVSIKRTLGDTELEGTAG